ncbi:hypothetical protein E2C01_059269 [Portunus trituberculatus]|uniref:Uncharacterized protein n=1 Tax=Portunus trituberculatus TaxID=210409 RepID=A0A5B7GYP6_PORTR|nr:hypothetical protein [Portunus trituberculatus]
MQNRPRPAPKRTPTHPASLHPPVPLCKLTLVFHARHLLLNLRKTKSKSSQRFPSHSACFSLVDQRLLASFLPPVSSSSYPFLTSLRLLPPRLALPALPFLPFLSLSRFCVPDHYTRT